VSFREVPDIARAASDAIVAGKVVAWYDGRMEVGARALGGRSILADATAPGIQDHVNKRVKFRDLWRPLCPSMTVEAAQRYVDGASETRFMTVAYTVPEARRAEIPAVVHVDGSMRPQTVTATSQPRYHGVIEAVGRAKGVPVILNTSLNVKGEPIACTPMDALRCFFSSGIDAMALQGFWVEKKG
jgi:carbamoyltransferase